MHCSVNMFSHKYKQAYLYIFFGCLTTIVSLGTYVIFQHYLSEPDISNILSWIVGVFFAYVTNKWYVFESKNLEKKTLMKESTMFYGSRLFTGIIAIGIFSLLTYLWPDSYFLGVEGLYYKIIASTVEIILNWLFSKHVVFKQ